MFARVFRVSLCLFLTVLCIKVYGKRICIRFTNDKNAHGEFVWTKHEICCKGYIQDETSLNKLVCNAICVPACVNGTCKTPGRCWCNSGHLPDPDRRNVCQPVCSIGCAHGTCSAPETCTCDHGYTLIDNQCIPVCTEPCYNGTCVAPEYCKCNPGYRLSHRNLCEPYCSTGCNVGSCVAPDTCGCDEGWEMVESVCRPICMEPCNNATCVAPSSCQCDQGYSNYNSTSCKLSEDEPSTTVDATTVDWLVQTIKDDEATLEDYSYNYSLFADYTDVSTYYARNWSAGGDDNVMEQNWIWIMLCVIVLLVAFLIVLAIVKRKPLLDLIKGRTYDVEEVETKKQERDADFFNVQFSAVTQEDKLE